MFKKVSILTLLLLFFVSTTGLPLTIHFCNILNKEVKSACILHTPQKKTTEINCMCEKEESRTNITSIKEEECCTIKVVIAGVKDSFISNKTETQNQSVTIILPVTVTSLPKTEQEISTYTFIDTSPPLQQDNSLYLSNSILLI